MPAEYSGVAGVREDEPLAGDLEPDAHRARDGAGPGRVVPDVVCVRPVRPFCYCFVFWTELTWDGRYSEGRRLWTMIGLASRNLAHMVRAWASRDDAVGDCLTVMGADMDTRAY